MRISGNAPEIRYTGRIRQKWSLCGTRSIINGINLTQILHWHFSDLILIYYNFFLKIILERNHTHEKRGK